MPTQGTLPSVASAYVSVKGAAVNTAAAYVHAPLPIYNTIAGTVIVATSLSGAISMR